MRSYLTPAKTWNLAKSVTVEVTEHLAVCVLLRCINFACEASI